MGTETVWKVFQVFHFLRVKLNNPLMGTETLTIIAVVYSLRIRLVKLNNPLMGTEITSVNPLECRVTHD